MRGKGVRRRKPYGSLANLLNEKRQAANSRKKTDGDVEPSVGPEVEPEHVVLSSGPAETPAGIVRSCSNSVDFCTLVTNDKISGCGGVNFLGPPMGSQTVDPSPNSLANVCPAYMTDQPNSAKLVDNGSIRGQGTYELLLFNAASVLAYFGMFRISELVFTTVLHSDRPLMIDDISFQNNDQLVKIRIRISKTSNKGSPIELIIPCETDAKFCPIRSLRHYFDDLHFRSHSFRIGRVTQLANDGVSMDVIQRLGRWKSYNSY
ncbi:hypothetical protein MAR_030705 [Mya arenaria]|uniref:Uncharacterized protein n=1 Tax=Mya arenaria TaxID=6604 RepID=A0ABY7F4Z4_MYAAR|nr:hypothetical protein MAR_030705 [Mya arenaria]